MAALPIQHILPQLRETLRTQTRVVLQAPPGAGKTTGVPLALLHEPWLAEKRILMLEPRRLATRGAARWMATTLNQRVGELVGYRMRMDTQVGPRTRVEVVTEGILTRMLQSDPTLDGVGLLIFDEFHERNLNSDLGLALALQSQQLVREDLRILIMSATLDGSSISALLGGATVLTSEGRSYPVEIRYVSRRREIRMESTVALAIREAVARDEGDILVFLPGSGEIRRVADMLERAGFPPHVHVAPLYGSLPQQEQEFAIAASLPGHRKIVLSTSIAETSLTIEGVGVVIDSGFMRVPRFSPRSGMTHLETVRVSRAAADQRCGRAGRLAPGVCYRLWEEQEQLHMVPHRTPEILEADLAPLALELAVAGISGPQDLRWLDPPPAGAYAQAMELLEKLGALDACGRLTQHGQRMAQMPMHPRLAHMLLAGERLGHSVMACHVAALLGQHDILYADSGINDADIRMRLEILLHSELRAETQPVSQRGDRRAPAFPSTVHGYRVDRPGCQRIVAEARQWQRQLRRSADEKIDLDAAGILLSFAYPDRIAQRRPGSHGRFLLRNGRGAALGTPQPLSSAAYLVAADMDGKVPESRIFLAAQIEMGDIETHHGAEIDTQTLVTWDDGARAVRARMQKRLGVLVLQDGSFLNPDQATITAALLDGIRRTGSSALPWNDASRRMQARLRFMHARDPAWPDVSDETLLATMDMWLSLHVYGMNRLDDLQRLDLSELFLGMLTWEQRTELDQRAPTHYVVPTGSRIPVDYGNSDAPVLAVRLQEMFGLKDTPSIDRDTVRLTLHLLSPAHRPVQVTQDLAGFWRTSYFDVKKELKGRYPRHSWPDDPLQAAPTRRAKPRPSPRRNDH